VADSNNIPFLELNISPIRSSGSLCSGELLEITSGIIWAAIDAR
jgi:hypothetical protein